MQRPPPQEFSKELSQKSPRPQSGPPLPAHYYLKPLIRRFRLILALLCLSISANAFMIGFFIQDRGLFHSHPTLKPQNAQKISNAHAYFHDHNLEQLLGALQDRTPLNHGFCVADMACALLAQVHEIDLERALDKPLSSLEPYKATFPTGSCELYAALQSEDHQRLADFITEEEFPFTCKKLHHLAHSDFFAQERKSAIAPGIDLMRSLPPYRHFSAFHHHLLWKQQEKSGDQEAFLKELAIPNLLEEESLSKQLLLDFWSEASWEELMPTISHTPDLTTPLESALEEGSKELLLLLRKKLPEKIEAVKGGHLPGQLLLFANYLSLEELVEELSSPLLCALLSRFEPSIFAKKEFQGKSQKGSALRISKWLAVLEKIEHSPRPSSVKLIAKEKHARLSSIQEDMRQEGALT